MNGSVKTAAAGLIENAGDLRHMKDAKKKPRGMTYWDRPMLERFRKAYYAAADAHDTAFTFEGRDFAIASAWNLIEYLDKELP